MAAVYKSLSKGAGKAEAPANGVRKNKQRVLIVPSRGVTFLHRHLIGDLANMLPHARKDAKFDSKSKLYQASEFLCTRRGPMPRRKYPGETNSLADFEKLCELAELHNCNNVLFFEARKGKDLYLWLSRVPNGPTIKFHCQNIHTMDQLNFVGNCLKGSRPILSFDASFEKEPHLRVIKQLFLQTFGVPEGARRSKPFIDHVMSFTLADGKIWIRVYQINEVDGKIKAGEDGETEATTAAKGRNKETDLNLVEIGPRVVLTPIIIQEGSFGGPIIYENRQFVSPNQVRADLRRSKATKHNARAEQYVERLARKGDLGLRTSGGKTAQKDALDSRQLFA